MTLDPNRYGLTRETDNDDLGGDDGLFDCEAVVAPLVIMCSCVCACVFRLCLSMTLFVSCVFMLNREQVGRYMILVLPMLYGVWHTKGRYRGVRILPNSRAIVLQQCGQSRRDGENERTIDLCTCE